MKKSTVSFLIIVALVIACIGIVLCIATVYFVNNISPFGVAGTYVNQDNPSEYLELNTDGTFYVEEAGMSISGHWEVKGSKLMLSWMGLVVTGEIKGNKIYGNEGKIWVRR